MQYTVCVTQYDHTHCGLLTKLQSVQNAAARFVTMSRKFDHITPVLRDLHWLPVLRD